MARHWKRGDHALQDAARSSAAASELGIAVVLALVSAAIDAGELPRRDPETTAQILLGALIEVAMLIVVAEDRAAARARSELVIVDLLEGLRL